MAKKRKPLPPAGAAPRERRMAAESGGPARPARPPMTPEERQRWRRLGFIALALVPLLGVMAATTGGGTATFVLIAFALAMIWIALVALRRARE